MTSRTRRQHERVRERAILMTGDSVRAILAGRKTQTRRKVRFPGWACGVLSDPLKIGVETDDAGRDPEVICESTGCLAALPLPYAIGDRLWVRETWQLHARASDVCTVVYRASIDGGWTAAHEQFPDTLAIGMRPKPFQAGWRSPSHMPRWASRLTLSVTDVRVERLQDISEADAIAEGFQPAPGGWWSGAEGQAGVTPRAAYALLWNSSHGPGAWDANPWVDAISFTVDRASASIAGAAT